jgi:hypothetical protein
LVAISLIKAIVLGEGLGFLAHTFGLYFGEQAEELTMPDKLAYPATKGAIEAFTLTLAVEVAPAVGSDANDGSTRPESGFSPSLANDGLPSYLLISCRPCKQA